MSDTTDIYTEHRDGGEYIMSVSRITDGLDVVVIDPPFEATAYLNDDDTISIYYGIGDGMSLGECELSDFLCGYAEKPGEKRDWTTYVRSMALYDLHHAFFHTSIDPNYGSIHYALLGCLALNGRAKYRAEDGSFVETKYVP